ncbi:hypothetical protein CEXT_443031 [Caerostris extrusa]|uniref:Transposase n=1 Tax=Caerostris extrusa TaxID=172846 RepID=A0AAV4NNM9_CAEEX|nr:hypothetical protein CEXT_443031 [Caerostris extrusa]
MIKQAEMPAHQGSRWVVRFRNETEFLHRNSIRVATSTRDSNELQFLVEALSRHSENLIPHSSDSVLEDSVYAQLFLRCSGSGSNFRSLSSRLDSEHVLRRKHPRECFGSSVHS